MMTENLMSLTSVQILIDLENCFWESVAGPTGGTHAHGYYNLFHPLAAQRSVSRCSAAENPIRTAFIDSNRGFAFREPRDEVHPEGISQQAGPHDQRRRRRARPARDERDVLRLL